MRTCGGRANEAGVTRAGPVENERLKLQSREYPQVKSEMEGVMSPCSEKTL